MSETLSPALGVVVSSVLLLLGVCLVLVLWRLVRGPSLPDRVVALDLMAMVVVGVVAVLTIASERSEVLHAAMVLALVSFLGTIAFARYVEKRGAP